MKEPERIVGPAGMVVAENVRRFRSLGGGGSGIPYAELSRWLADRGHDIPPLGLRRIEAGQRKVSVDDLVALADVLSVSPLALLLPDGGPADIVAYRPDALHDPDIASLWKWCLGLKPLDLSKPSLFRARSTPEWLTINAEVEGHGDD
ncbi:helix-turn-helix domain-containing protein [Pseudarthrobacter phenanthrenivorans]|uniref:helix-turn-helix domain-containing protein n=1 Tax=Pseudarthrobacter phenanthrenivorans TaxID=361575 RepID=UPI0015FF5824|nr:helix-turn-helix transcriptional regulator [Pseudarthrobacter phenanthrenivorans]